MLKSSYIKLQHCLKTVFRHFIAGKESYCKLLCEQLYQSYAIFCISLALCRAALPSICCVFRYSDPVYLKVKKLDVLAKLVTESNGKQILDELRCGTIQRCRVVRCVAVWCCLVGHAMVCCDVV